MDVEHIKKMMEKEGIVFLTYGGFLSQELIGGMTEALEKEAEYNNINITQSNNIFTIFIELSQNMMNYAKSKYENQNKSEGLIMVGIVHNESDSYYYVLSQNIVSSDDKLKLEPKLEEITTLDQEGIKKRYIQNRHVQLKMDMLVTGI
jgi:hypothetical protein